MSNKNSRKKIATSVAISVKPDLKVITGMTLMLLLASAAISGILTWYIFQ
jgi:hypothetical protein